MSDKSNTTQQQQQQATAPQQEKKKTRRGKPKQVKASEPVTEEVANQSKKTANANKNKGIAASVGQPIQKGNPGKFNPTALTTVGTVERNDPLLSDAILVDGISGAVECAKDRNFELDFSQFIQIVKSSYQVMTRLDRGLQKFLSLSAYQYYCIVLLWKRIKFVMTERGEGVNEYAALEMKLPSMSIPDEIGYYLDGIGNIKDYNGLNYFLSLQDNLRQTLVNGISGTFGIIDATSHISYETLPAPFVCVQRMLWDLALSKGSRRVEPININADWDLPDELKPNLSQYQPNRNLLGWDRARLLTSEQIQMLEYAGIDVTFNGNVPEFDTTGVDNYAGIPIIRPMLLQISELLSGSKSPHNNHAESTSYKGSLAQIGFIIRDDFSRQTGFVLPAVYQRNGTGMFFTQVSVHMCSATSVFRYRINRRVDGVNDSLCYLGAQGGAPQNWATNSNDVFLSVPEWNYQNFRTTLTNGERTSSDLSEKVRRISPK